MAVLRGTNMRRSAWYPSVVVLRGPVKLSLRRQKEQGMEPPQAVVEGKQLVHSSGGRASRGMKSKPVWGVQGASRAVLLSGLGYCCSHGIDYRGSFQEALRF